METKKSYVELGTLKEYRFNPITKQYYVVKKHYTEILKPKIHLHL